MKMFSKVITVCLNPSLDVTVWIKELDFEEPCTAQREEIYPGGKGINVARVLTMLNVPVKAYCLAGQDNLEMLKTLLVQEQVAAELFPVKSAIRENMTLVLKDGRVLKINRAGPTLKLTDLDQIYHCIKQSINDDTILVFAGSLPPGIEKSVYRDFIMQFRRQNIRVVIDTGVFEWEDYQQIKPFMIKPNRVELEKIFHTVMPQKSDLEQAALKLAEDIQHVLVSLGKDGLLYAGNQQIKYISVPEVEMKSTVGAGDTTLAGFLAKLLEACSLEQALCFAAAAGTASVCCDGTEIPKLSDIDQIQKQVQCITIS